MTRLVATAFALTVAVLIAAALWTYATAADPACPAGQARVLVPGGGECRDAGQFGGRE